MFRKNIRYDNDMTFTRILRYLTANSKLGAIAQHFLKKFSSSIAIFKNMPRLFRLVWSATPIALLISVALTLTSSLLPAAQLYISKLIVDQVVPLKRARW